MHFGPMFAAGIRTKRVRQIRSFRWRWHLDEMFIQVNGTQLHLWRALDHDGEALEAYTTRHSDKTAARKLLRKLM